MSQLLKHLPPVHELLTNPAIREAVEARQVPDGLLKEWLQNELSALREDVINNSEQFQEASRALFTSHIEAQIMERLKTGSFYSLRPVLNGTGTVLHTNLGRARLSERALKHVHDTSKHYSTLEYDLGAGGRGSRLSLVEGLLKQATGAEAAMAVNNNAAAVYMILRALANDHEVIVSRGELIEIGGSFRVSSIMEESGARLVEVGTTNKTHLPDYEDAITEQTAMIMKVHTSNFATVGFTADVGISDLTGMVKAKEQEVILYEDLGSGSLFPYSDEGIGDEPVVKQALAKGADIVSFSGDKLLGGPQAGIICGSKKLIDRLKKHSLARVLRLDKMTLAALEATLFDYVYDNQSRDLIPALRDIRKKEEEIKENAKSFMGTHNSYESLFIRLHPSVSKIGGGTMPLEERSTWGILVSKQGASPNQIEAFLRKQDPPLIARVMAEGVYIDFRTISSEEEKSVADHLKALDCEHFH